MAGQIDDQSRAVETGAPTTTHRDPRVTVIMLAFRRPSLPDVVAKLAERTHDTSYDVRVLLNGATDAVVESVRARIDDRQIVASPNNLGFGAGVNRAAAGVTTEYLALLNDDTEVCDGWLDRLVATADELPAAAMISSRLLYPDGRLQEAGARLSLGGIGVQFGRDTVDDDPALHQRRLVDYGSGAAVLIRRSVFADVGGFDEAFFPAYYEDVDLALRIRAAGWQIIYEPDAVVVHEQWGSTTSLERELALEYNRQKFLQRWGSMFSLREEDRFVVPAEPIPVASDVTPPTRADELDDPAVAYNAWLLAQLSAGFEKQREVEAQRSIVEAELAARQHAMDAELAHARTLVKDTLARADQAEARANAATARAEAAEARAEALAAEQASWQATLTWRARHELGKRLHRR